MNRIVGFFREKLSEAKEENQNDLQNIVSAFEAEPYSKSKMLAHMQEIKTNYLEWNIMIANEASTGLYFAQLHNKNCALKKARTLRDNENRLHKNQIVLGQMHKTIHELKAIDRLNKEWANDMNRKVQKLHDLVAKQPQPVEQQMMRNRIQRQRQNQEAFQLKVMRLQAKRRPVAQSRTRQEVSWGIIKLKFRCRQNKKQRGVKSWVIELIQAYFYQKNEKYFIIMGISVSTSKQLEYLQARHLQKLKIREENQQTKSATLNPEPPPHHAPKNQKERIATSPRPQPKGFLEETIDYDRQDSIPSTRRRTNNPPNSHAPTRAASDQLVIRSSSKQESTDKPVNLRGKKVNLAKKR